AHMTDGTGVEVGTIGDEGMAGLSAYLQGEATEGETLVQIPGSAIRLRMSILIDEAQSRPAVRRLLGRYAQAYMTQLAQNAACKRYGIIRDAFERMLATGAG